MTGANLADIEAEEEVAGGAVARRDGYERALRFCHPDDFSDPRWAKVFQAAALVWAQPTSPYPGDGSLDSVLAWNPHEERMALVMRLSGIKPAELRRVVDASLWQPERFARRVFKMAERRRAALAHQAALRALEDGSSVEEAEAAYASTVGC